MAILVDNAHWPNHGRMWCHLVSDASLEELHEFARALGLPHRGFDLDHYDLPESLREQAIALGAEAVESRELMRRLRASGLRRRKAEQPAPVLRPVWAT